MSCKIKLLFVSMIFFLTFSFVSAKDLSSPIVKVINYKNIYGKYIENLWWGSATIINNKWYIVTNNHVVEDWEWNESDYFNICITRDENKKPDCDYTATLVERSKDLDFAVLRINEKDIYWEKVDFWSFWYLDIDFNYDIKLQDEVFAIWYPWIWSETITKTKWIISWTTKYNGYTYIKSDTLISWWNSWWALVNSKWKLIWIPTFLVWFWTNIWYSIYVKEIKNFLVKALDKEIWEIDKSIENFISNKVELNQINKNLKIDDDLISMSIDNVYEVKNYIKDKKIEIKPKLENEHLINNVNIWIINTPNIKEKKDYFYYLEENGFYYKSFQKLRTKEIWWIEFYYPISIWDSTWWESDASIMYFTKIGSDKILFISVFRPITEDSNNNKIVNRNLEKLLWEISFKEETINSIEFNFDIKYPKLSIKNRDDLMLNESAWYWALYFDNLYDYFFFWISELSVAEWKWKEIEDIFRNETLNIDEDYKSIIKKDGHSWFVYCFKDDYSVKDENGFDVKQNRCVIKIYEDMKWTNDKEYYFYWVLFSNKNKIEDNLTKSISFLENNISFNRIKDLDNNIVNIYENIIPLKFTDLDLQSDVYKNMLKKLVKYNLLNNTRKFNAEKPIKWKELVLYYFRYAYNYKFKKELSCKEDKYICLFKNNHIWINWKKVSIYDLTQNIWIPLEEYVDKNKVNNFLRHIELELAWIEVKNYSEKWFYKYKELYNDKSFSPIKQNIDLFRNETFWKDNVYIKELLWTKPLKYKYINEMFYNIDKFLIVSKRLYSDDKYDYSSITKIWEDNYSNACWLNGNNCYPVLTKAEMIDRLVILVDFTLFDKKLESRKSSIY